MDAQTVSLTNSLGIAALVPLLIEWAKNSKLPMLAWLDHGTVIWSRLLSLAFAAATAAGLVVGFDGSFWSGGTLTVANLSIWTLPVFLWEMAKQFGLQELAYRAAVKPETPGPPA